MSQNFDRICDRLRFPETLTVGVFKNSSEIRPADLPRELRQPPPKLAEQAACRLPCRDSIRHIVLRGFANRHAGVPGAQHGEFVGIRKIQAARFG